MQSRHLHLLSIFAASAILLGIVSGAAVTSSHDQLRYSALLNVHIAVAIAAALLLIALAIKVKHAWIAVIAMAFEILAPKQWATPIAWMVHATLGALVVAMLSVIALRTSAPWQREPEMEQDYGWPSLRSLSLFAALLVGMQVAFGAGMRHSVIGVMPHLLGALLVVIFIVIVGIFAMTQFPKHPILRPMAVTLLVITGIQVFLGMAAFFMRMMNMSASIAWLIISVAHVTSGNLTFASSVLLAAEIRRDVRPRQAQ